MKQNIFIKKSFNKDQHIINESLFTLANGYLGIRASFEEGIKENIATSPAIFINGFYDYFDVQYGSKYHGYPDVLQKMICLTDILGLDFYIDDTHYKFDEKKITNYEMLFDMNSGCLIRSYTYNINKEENINFIFKRIISFSESYLMIQKIFIKPNLKNKKNIKVQIKLDNFNKKNVKNIKDKRVSRVSESDINTLEEISCYNEKNVLIKISEAKRSQKKILAASKVSFNVNKSELINTSNNHKLSYETNLFNDEIIFSKTNLIWDDKLKKIEKDEAIKILNNFSFNSFEDETKRNNILLKKVWENNDISFENKELEQAYRFNFYHLYSHAGRYPWTSIGAKGLSGEGYNGHYFWDTEVYVIPALALSSPEITKNLISYRYYILDAAIKRARELNHDIGCLFTWRTINGDESSPYYPAGTAQYHINGDVAYGVMFYYWATKDINFLIDQGFELLWQTALLWIDKSNFWDGSYHINSVTGPDEYQILIDNDFYTNNICRFNISSFLKVREIISQKNNNTYEKLEKKLNITQEQIEKLIDIKNKIIILYEDKLKINPEHNSFLARKKVNMKELEKFKPLVMKMHPLTINNMQITKQADVVLSDFMLGNEKGKQIMKNNYKFYKNIDTSDSSLSECIYAIQAARLKIDNFGLNTFYNVLQADIKNMHKNTAGGIHIANMAGARMYVMYGLLGVDLSEDTLKINPIFVKEIGTYKISFTYENQIIKVCVNKEKIHISKNNKNYLKIICKENKYILKKELELDI